MPRPIKRRNVCCMPNNCRFGALDSENVDHVVTMAVDEYETIRLIDLEGCTQEECAREMNVARTTVQGIYNDARRKLAEFLVNGGNLEIDGGEYVICSGRKHGCRRHECMNCNRKERTGMKIAIPANEKNVNDEVCMSYGRTPYFAIYDAETKEYTFLDNSATAASGGAGVRASQNLIDEGVTVVITPRLGQNAAEVLLGSDVAIYRCNDVSIQENVNAFLENKLTPLNEFHAGFHGHGEH